jgi:hypothetical protein
MSESYVLTSNFFKITLTNVKELNKKLFSDIFLKIKKIEDGYSQNLEMVGIGKKCLSLVNNVIRIDTEEHFYEDVEKIRNLVKNEGGCR